MSEERYFYEAQCWIADWGVLAYDRDPIAIQALARCLQEAHQNGRRSPGLRVPPPRYRAGA